MSFTYTQNVPNPPNLPSADVGNMQTNTNSIFSILNVDHESFGSQNNIDGRHKQVSLINEVAPGVPASIGGVLFANNPAGSSQPFWQNGIAPANVFQIFTYSSVTSPVVSTTGFTYLPGGLIMQWGIVNNPASTGTQAYPIPFPTNVFGVFFNFGRNASSVDSFWINTAGVNNLTQFAWRASTGSASFLYWQAIGN